MLWSTTPAEYTKFDSAGLPVSLTDTPGTGHCNFTTDQLLVVAKTLVAAGTTGKLPKRSATSALVRRTENLTTDPYFEPALLKYYDKL